MNNILLIDDHEIIRSGVRNILPGRFKPEEIFEASDEASAIRQLKARPYSLIISDVRMPDSQPFGLIEYILTQYPNYKILIFSMNEEHLYAKKFLQAGAMGFVSKNADLAELLKAIDLVLSGRKYISDTLRDDLLDSITINHTEKRNPFQTLSQRELEISILLVEGRSSSEIARTLAIAQSTVGTIKTRIFSKLGVKNLAEMIELSRANGL